MPEQAEGEQRPELDPRIKDYFTARNLDYNEPIRGSLVLDLRRGMAVTRRWIHLRSRFDSAAARTRR
jgi:hypothetical protein